MKTKAIFLSLFILGLAQTSCDSDADDSFENGDDAQTSFYLTGEFNTISPHCLVFDESNNSNKYSRIDSIGVFGYGMEYLIPDSLKDCDLNIMISGKWRETGSITGNIAVSLQNYKDSITYFNVINADKSIKAINTWSDFSDSLTITKSQNTSASKLLKIFSGKSKGNGFLDVDDLKITVKKN